MQTTFRPGSSLNVSATYDGRVPLLHQCDMSNIEEFHWRHGHILSENLSALLNSIIRTIHLVNTSLGNKDLSLTKEYIERFIAGEMSHLVPIINSRCAGPHKWLQEISDQRQFQQGTEQRKVILKRVFSDGICIFRLLGTSE